MRLAIFNDYRLGVVSPDGKTVSDVSAALPWPHDLDPLGVGWWVRLCRDFGALSDKLRDAAEDTPGVPLAEVRLRPPALNPTKVIAAAANYADHRREMVAVRARTGAGGGNALAQFDVFLKAPSSLSADGDAVLLPPGEVAAGHEIHHESELAVIIGEGGSKIPAERALAHVLGYTIALDMTVRGPGDRSRRKSHDTFTPLGPWITTADDVPDPQDLHIILSVNGVIRQDVRTTSMDTSVAGLIAYASAVMTLLPGDVILTGAPPGVGPVRDGDRIETSISGIGTMSVPVRLATGETRA